MSGKLTPRQKKFVEEYLIDLNATRAAIAAGYSEKGATVRGSELLTNRNVCAALNKANEERQKRAELSADMVLEELKAIAFSDMRDFAYWNESGVSLKESDSLSDIAAKAVAEVSESTNAHGGQLKFKLYDKLSALEKLGKHLKIFEPDKEHGDINITVSVPVKEIE